jgi:G6PDH family F420-dependent oxidoreductase
MTMFGFSTICEQHSPAEVVRYTQRAEQAGFDFCTMSDHYHPWLNNQGHSAFAWSLLGACAQQTSTIQLMTMVTCPIIRYHPAIVAQAAATVSLLSEGRFVLGVGAGEQLNEHVVGQPWPPVDVRHEMLHEAIEIMQQLWQGGFRSYRGRYFTVQDAQVYDLPDRPVPVGVAAGGREAARLAGSVGDHLIATEPREELITAYRAAGGRGHTYGQMTVCVGDDESACRKLARDRWRFALPGWKVQAELPRPANFEADTAMAREEDIAELVSCGPDPGRHKELIDKFVDAGFDHITLIQVGPDQEGFFSFWEDKLAKSLGLGV